MGWDILLWAEPDESDACRVKGEDAWAVRPQSLRKKDCILTNIMYLLRKIP